MQDLMNTTTAKTAQKTTKVTIIELVAIMAKITASTFGSIIYFVDESGSRTINKKKALQKLVYIPQIAFNHSYTNKVNNLIKKAIEDGTLTPEYAMTKFGFDVATDTFVAKELKGKTRVNSNTLMSDKTEKFLLDAKVLKNITPVVEYFHNDERITKSDAIKRDLFAPSYFNNKPTKGRGILPQDEDFNIINTAYENIVYLKVGGVSYEVVK